MQIKIRDSSICKGKTQYAVYHLTFTTDEVQWEIAKRYSEIVALRDHLVRNLKISVHLVPELPKPFFSLFSAIDDRTVAERKVRINSFFSRLISEYHDTLLTDIMFCQFIKIDNQLLESANMFPMTFRGEIFNPNHPLFGVRSFVFNAQKNVLITANEDAYIASRFDSYLSNFKLPFLDQTDQGIVPVGVLSTWSYDQKKQSWEIGSNLYYEERIGAIEYVPEQKYVYVGLNTHIYLYELTNDYKLIPKKDIQIHNDDICDLTALPSGHIISLSINASLCLYHTNDEIVKGNVRPNAPKKNIVSSSLTIPSLCTCLIATDTNVRYFTYPDPSDAVALYQLDHCSPLLEKLAIPLQIPGRIYSMSYLAERKILCLASKYTLQLYRYNAGSFVPVKIMKLYDTISCIELVYVDDSWCLVVGHDNGCITVVNNELLDIKRIKAHQKEVTQLTWHKESNRIITGGLDGRVNFWTLGGNNNIKGMEP